MKSTTLKELETKSKNTNELIYKSKEFIEFIQKDGGTINIYKNEYFSFLLQFRNGKNEKLNYSNIGICFTGLMLYIHKPIISDNELKKELGTTNDMIVKVRELISIYNKTMLKPYKKGINGKNGGAPKGNKNAKTT